MAFYPREIRTRLFALVVAHSFKGKKWSFEKILDGLFAVYVAMAQGLSMTS